MQARHLTRRFMLLLPLAVAACGGGDDDDLVYAPLRYNDLPPIQVKVATIAIEQRFIPAGAPPDVSNLDPAPPSEALKAMANDRLQAFGTSNKAVFSILDASLTRNGDTITGSLGVSLTIVDDSGTRLGFAEAHVQSRHTGSTHGLRSVLYDMTKSMMYDMNIEFEYQIRHNLKSWLTDGAAPAAPVEQAPLDGSGPSAAPAPTQPDAPTNPQPTYLQPPGSADSAGAPPPASPAQGYPPPTYLQPPTPLGGSGASQPTSPTSGYPPPTYLQPPQPQPQ